MTDSTNAARDTKNAAGVGAPIAGASTPALSLDLDAVDHNIATMADWCRSAGVDLAPHGKTTMMPAVWRRQLDAGAWGITVATAFQLEVARAAGVPHVILAGTTFHPTDLERILEGTTDVLLWVDSEAAVRLLDAAVAAIGGGRLHVLAEFGSPLGRTGARTTEAFRRVVDAVSRAEHLVLAGVAGYEGALTHDIEAAGLTIVDDYLAALLAVFDDIRPESFADRLTSGGDVVLTAGGSVYPDRVITALSPRHDPEGRRGERVRVVLRSGAYVAHDHGLYERLSPLSRASSTAAPTSAAPPFRPAIELWATVLSRPEPELVLLNIGRRDTADDEGLPVVLDAWAADGVKRSTPEVRAAAVTALNDQHAFIRIPPGNALDVGDLVRLGISHPCTTLDKWRTIAFVRGGTADRAAPPMVVDVAETFF